MVLKQIENVLTLIIGFYGAVVFSVGAGSIAMGCLRLTGIHGLYSLLAYPVILVLSLLASFFAKLFFIRFAIPVRSLFDGELDSDNFTVSQFFICLTLTLSLPALLFFAFVPSFWPVGIAGTISFTTFIFLSKSLTEKYLREKNPKRQNGITR